MAITTGLRTLCDDELLARLRALVARSNEAEADLIEHLAELDQRRLYLPSRTSLWDFCLIDLGFSENVAANRIAVARESLRFPRIVEMLRTGQIHLTGLRMLCGQLTTDNCDELLAEAIGKTKREIEELLVRHRPRPPVLDAIRKVRSRLPAAAAESAPLLRALACAPPVSAPGAVGRPPSPLLVPLTPETYKVQFTASRELRDKIREAQDLLRHGNPAGDLAAIVDRALTLLITEVKKERWAVGRKPRTAALGEGPARSRDIPDGIKRAVYERDGGRCAYVGPEGSRCEERGWLQLDHVDGFARTKEHRVESLRLACRAHNQYAADEMYGREWMDAKRADRDRTQLGGEDHQTGQLRR